MPRLFRFLLAALVLVMSGLALLGRPAVAADFSPLTVSPEQQARYAWSDEARFAHTDWQGIEQETMKLADRRIGSFDGVATGWPHRPVRIHYRMYLNRQERLGAVVIVPGFTEGLTIYQELIHDLVRNGYSVYIHDHRNQGFSTRLLEGDKQADKGHLDRFDRLVTDLERFLRLVSEDRQRDVVRSGRPVFALAHSMGGAVVALHLARQGAQTPFSGVALVTPMFEPTMARRDDRSWGARTLRSWCHSGAFDLPFSVPWLSERRASGQPFEQEWTTFRAMSDPARHPQTHSVVRHRMRWVNRDGRCEGPDCGHGDARVSGPTYQWVDQACAGADEARGPGASRITVPVLLIQGSEDTVVEPAAQNAFCEQVNAPGSAGGRCIGLRMPTSRHGLLLEVDAMRTPALSRVLSFWSDVAMGTLAP